jgi:hypothetical protein
MSRRTSRPLPGTVIDVFDGEICGFGTTSGHRVVVGRWTRSPLGAFADVMLEDAAGHRTLFAPDQAVADYVTATYTFDEVRIERVDTRRKKGLLALSAGPLRAEVAIGRRAGLGLALQVVPRAVGRTTWFAGAVDPVARRVLRGVRTKGTAGNGRTEWYSASDMRRLDSVAATFERDDLGTLADVWPPVGFGFGSTPRSPSIVALRTTISRPSTSCASTSRAS